MRRRSKALVEMPIKSPTKGINTRVPSNLLEDEEKRSLQSGKNIRAMDGALQGAPGVAKIDAIQDSEGNPLTIQGTPLLIHNGNITSDSGFNVTQVPTLGTTSHLYSVSSIVTAPPQVYAGEDRIIVGTNLFYARPTVSDPNNLTLTYQWTVVSQPANADVFIARPTTLTPTFSVHKPNSAANGQYIFRLTVTNSAGLSAYDDVKVNFTEVEPIYYAPQIPIVEDFIYVNCGETVQVEVSEEFYQYAETNGTYGQIGRLVRYLESAYQIQSLDGDNLITVLRVCQSDPGRDDLPDPDDEDVPGEFAPDPGITIPGGATGVGYPGANPGGGGPTGGAGGGIGGGGVPGGGGENLNDPTEEEDDDDDPETPATKPPPLLTELNTWKNPAPLLPAPEGIEYEATGRAVNVTMRADVDQPLAAEYNKVSGTNVDTIVSTLQPDSSGYRWTGNLTLLTSTGGVYQTTVTPIPYGSAGGPLGDFSGFIAYFSIGGVNNVGVSISGPPPTSAAKDGLELLRTSPSPAVSLQILTPNGGSVDIGTSATGYLPASFQNAVKLQNYNYDATGGSLKFALANDVGTPGQPNYYPAGETYTYNMVSGSDTAQVSLVGDGIPGIFPNLTGSAIRLSSGITPVPVKSISGVPTAYTGGTSPATSISLSGIGPFTLDVTSVIGPDSEWKINGTQGPGKGTVFEEAVGGGLSLNDSSDGDTFSLTVGPYNSTLAMSISRSNVNGTLSELILPKDATDGTLNTTFTVPVAIAPINALSITGGSTFAGDNVGEYTVKFTVRNSQDQAFSGSRRFAVGGSIGGGIPLNFAASQAGLNNEITIAPKDYNSATEEVDILSGQIFHFKAGALGTQFIQTKGNPQAVTVVGGALPSGLQVIAESGLIYGTPATSAGDKFEVSVQATKTGVSPSPVRTITIYVDSEVPVVVLGTIDEAGSSPTNRFTATVGTAHTIQLLQGEGAGTIRRYRLKADAPTGVTINTTTGLITLASNMPAQASDFTVYADNGAGRSEEVKVYIDLQNPPSP